MVCDEFCFFSSVFSLKAPHQHPILCIVIVVVVIVVVIVLSSSRRKKRKKMTSRKMKNDHLLLNFFLKILIIVSKLFISQTETMDNYSGPWVPPPARRTTREVCMFVWGLRLPFPRRQFTLLPGSPLFPPSQKSPPSCSWYLNLSHRII